MPMIAPPMPAPDVALKPYRTLVEQFDQAQPMMLWATRDQITPVVVQEPEDWPQEASLSDLYAHCAEQLLRQLGQPSWVIVSAEAYWMPVTSMTEVEEYRHGEAEKRRAAGDTSVSDAVVITAVSTREDYTYVVPFTRTPHRVRWGTPEQAQAAGGIADLLKTLVR